MKELTKLFMRCAAERSSEILYNEETGRQEVEFGKKLPGELKILYDELSERMAQDQQERESLIYIQGMKDCYKLIKILEN